MPSVSLLMPWSRMFNLMLSNASLISPFGGPSLIKRSRGKLSAALFPAIGRLPAAPALVGGVIFEASELLLPRL